PIEAQRQHLVSELAVALPDVEEQERLVELAIGFFEVVERPLVLGQVVIANGLEVGGSRLVPVGVGGSRREPQSEYAREGAHPAILLPAVVLVGILGSRDRLGLVGRGGGSVGLRTLAAAASPAAAPAALGLV